ncbi:hypothetical protein [Xanthomonas sp. NCPPB 2632]|uniref:hypothetical protein n=1 Tax=Xanthomonas sp. NCPPB 2632 TaxID=3240912 RepID=UPI003510D7D5
MTPELLAALDELLDDYPRIDSREQVPNALKHAARDENLEAVAHLFERYGALVDWDNFHAWDEPDEDIDEPLPLASRQLITAVIEKRTLSASVPPPVEPAEEKPRARRL